MEAQKLKPIYSVLGVKLFYLWLNRSIRLLTHSTFQKKKKQSLLVSHWQGKFLSFICIKLLGAFIAAENKDVFILKFSTEDQFRYPTPNFGMVRNVKVIVLIIHL